MGVCNSPDIFQEKISKQFDGFDMVREYIDYVLVISKNNFEECLKFSDKVLQRIKEVELKVSVEKLFLGQT